MALLIHDCTRCGGNELGFVLVETHPATDRNGSLHAMLVCPRCSGPAVARMFNPRGYNVRDHDGDVRAIPGVQVEWIEPRPQTPAAPPFTPDVVAEYYVEACDSLHRKKWTSAASMLRKCMEVALKDLSPDIEAWKLEKRIDKLAADNRITPALKDWAHELRLDGNEALHGIEPATEELATRMERLTHFLLLYLYTLPKQVELARDERQNGN